MIVFAAILAALCGAVLGALTARKRQGTALDMAQYAAGYGIAFGVLALFLTLAIGAVG
jgi:hypothetical protein